MSDVDSALGHAKSSRNGDNEFAIVVGERFVVSARTSVLHVNALKAAVADLELQKLESMKDQGVSK